MAKVAVFVNWPGITAEQYDVIRKVANWENDRPKGGLLHVAAIDDEGLHVMDVWESAETFQNFLDTRILPNVVHTGATTQPEIKVVPIYAEFSPGYQK